MALNKYYWYISSKTCGKIGKIRRGRIKWSNIFIKGEFVSDGIGEKETKVGTKTEKESPWAGWAKEEKI